MKFSLTTTTLILSAFSLTTANAAPDGNLPYLATATLTGADHQSSFTSLLSSIASSIHSQPAYTSFTRECFSTIDSLPTQASIALYDADCDPMLIAINAADPTTTPAWFTQMPSDMQAYAESVGGVIQSAAHQVNGDANASGKKNGAPGGLVASLGAMLMSVTMALVAYL